MKKYKLLSCLLSLFLVLACGASCQGGNGANCGGCGAVATLKLKDFEDKTINVELGDYFSVASYMLVEDEAGNPYHVSAQIKTADGKAVAHMKY
ncbi:MAG: hypothetical protein IIX02_02395, partial [Clostridia bacterium]|nr:hypothetical protein [Clostridia bacterium]